MNLAKLARAAVAGAALLLGSCDRAERNVVVRRSPFFEDTMPYSQAETERVIATVHRFAQANGMDFLLSRDGPDPGDYNATAAGRDLNLKVIHTRMVSAGTTEISAYAPSEPTEADQKEARTFACVVKGRCGS
jgi:hypothetical protein